MSDGDLATKIAKLENELKWLKWIIPSACGFVAVLFLIFWGIETSKIGERVRVALEEAGITKASEEIEAARVIAVDGKNAILQVESDAREAYEALSRGAKVFAINVLSTDFVKDPSPKTNGEYFNFSTDEVDQALGSRGRDTWHGKKVFGINVRTGRGGTMTIWAVAGGSRRDQSQWGDGTGRFDDGETGKLYFEPGDKIVAIGR